MVTEMVLVKESVKKVFSDLVSKIVSDGVDGLKNAIKDADLDRRSYNQNLQTKLYQVMIDALNRFTYNKYEKQDKLYDAAENILKGFISIKDSTDAVKFGLKMLAPDVNSDTPQDFFEILCSEICRDENNDLYKELDMFWKKQEGEYIHSEFEKSNQNGKEILEQLDNLKEAVNFLKGNMNSQRGNKEEHNEIPIKNRANEYADKWNQNAFLNDFNKRDKNAGVNIKLKDIYLEEHLPYYVWKTNDEPLNDLKELLSEYTVDNEDKKMLLVLGQAGIGKSTLITWMMANLVEKKDDILIYQFANDLGNINWQSENVLDDIFKAIGLKYDELESKTLILDGFDEILACNDRERILNKLDQEIKKYNSLKAFSLIVTCRENYIYNLQNIKCDYITLQVWDEVQIENFCRTYWKNCGNEISEDKIQKILENKEIFGIPLILYMILALDITIEESSSIVDVYDQVFSLKRGGIYDRCYDTEHRINKPEIKKYIHQVSQKIAFWIFENNANQVLIHQEKFEEICKNEMNEFEQKGEDIKSDTLIGNFFKLNHCEGKGTDELQFVHRSIYEYFIAVYFFESIYELQSKEEVAGKLGELLKEGRLSEQILEFIKYKFDGMKGYNLSDITKNIFNIMLQDGMTYYSEEKYKNTIEQERNIFSNMLEIVGSWNSTVGEVDDKIVIYLQCNKHSGLNLKGIKLSAENFAIKRLDLRGTYLNKANLMGADLSRLDLRRVHLNGADLREANLNEVDLSRSDLIGAHLYGANLKGADLSKADLRYADLRNVDLRGAVFIGANLSRANLIGAELSEANLDESYLNMTLFDEEQVKILCGRKFDLNLCEVLLSETNEVISYHEYYTRIQKD